MFTFSLARLDPLPLPHTFETPTGNMPKSAAEALVPPPTTAQKEEGLATLD